MSAEQPLSALGTALLRNTTSTGVLSAYGGTTCTNQFLTALSATGAGTCADVNLATITLTGALGPTNGGTGFATVTQGDLIYASAADTWAKLAKSATATRYLSNTGASNNPAWAQVALATGVSGTLPVANGGTGLTAGTDGGILGFTATGTVASSVVLTASRIVLGGGAGATPTVLGSLGTTTTVLHGNAAGAPTFGAVDLSADTTGTVSVAKGGTAIASYAIGDLLYASGATTLSKLADVTAGRWLRSGGVTTAPAWSTTSIPNSATTGDVLIASGANTYANLADVAAGSYLRAGGVTTAPVWSTVTLPNSAVVGDLLSVSGTNVYANITAVGTGRVLSSMGVGTLPAWLTNPSSTTFEVSTAFLGPGTEATAGVVRLANTSLVTSRNAGDSANITLITATAADRVVVGSAAATGATFTGAGGSLNLNTNATPTVSAGFGTGPTVATGSVPSLTKITIGSGGDTSGVLLFNQTWATAPLCFAQNQTTTQAIRTTPTTTQVTLTGTLAASDIIQIFCASF